MDIQNGRFWGKSVREQVLAQLGNYRALPNINVCVVMFDEVVLYILRFISFTTLLQYYNIPLQTINLLSIKAGTKKQNVKFSNLIIH